MKKLIVVSNKEVKNDVSSLGSVVVGIVGVVTGSVPDSWFV